MPIFMSSYQDDGKLIGEMASAVAAYWNTYGGVDYGFQVVASQQAVNEMVRGGDETLAAFFPEEPGPFKRVAATLVMARLTPLFTLVSPDSTDDNLKHVPANLEHLWVPRIPYLLLDPAFAAVKLTQAGVNGHSLDENWHGFPSLHSKSEFLFWLEWLCEYPAETLRDEAARLERRGRMILATSLILEAVYLQYGAKQGICGTCDKYFFEHCGDPALFTFDAMLNENYRRQHPES